MKLRNTFFMLALSVSMAFLITSCTTEPGTPPVTGTAPTGVQANSISATQINVRWTRDATDVTADTIIAADPTTGAVLATTPVLSTASAGSLTGLQLNQKYDIWIGSAGGRSAKVTWATATRSGPGFITLYETADNTNGHFSGLVLGPNPHGASITGAEKTFIDLVLASRSDLGSPFISLQAASVDSSGIIGGRATKLGNSSFTVGGGIDKDFYSTGFSGEFSSGINSFPYFNEVMVSDTTTIVLVKTADNHYARVEIQKQPSNGNKLFKNITGSNGKPYRAIDVVVSYQPIIDAAYAGRPTEVRRGTNERPVLAGRSGVRK